jgi:hypothetical protein
MRADEEQYIILIRLRLPENEELLALRVLTLKRLHNCRPVPNYPRAPLLRASVWMRGG